MSIRGDMGSELSPREDEPANITVSRALNRNFAQRCNHIQIIAAHACAETRRHEAYCIGFEAVT